MRSNELQALLEERPPKLDIWTQDEGGILRPVLSFFEDVGRIILRTADIPNPYQNPVDPEGH